MKLAPEDPWGALPAAAGGLKIETVALERVTEVLPVGGADVSESMQAGIGAGFPQAGRCERAGGVLVLWSGRDAALVVGPEVDVDGALCVDQSDGWAALSLSGAVRDALARLCPLDLRERSFPVGSAARSLLKHVPVLLARVADEEWLLLAPRSMAGTVGEELVDAARGLVARRADASGDGPAGPAS